MRVKVGYIQNGRLRKLERELELLDIENLDRANLKALYLRVANLDELKEILKKEYPSYKEFGIYMIDDIDYKKFWFFNPNIDEHIYFFEEFFDGIIFDEEWTSRDEVSDEITQKLKPLLLDFVIYI